jgi:dihydroorotate dehydrogenase
MSLARADQLARWEARCRPLLTLLPPALATRCYSAGRRYFLGLLAEQPPRRAVTPPAELARTLWGIRFRSPIFNAAGMFKRGDGYAVAARQGAGAWLAGTTTDRPRTGNRRAGIATPFAPYPRSKAASNWLGLPNPGHADLARRLHGMARIDGCPIGVSVAADPDAGLKREQKLEGLLRGLRLYQEAGVDFLEMNESCPNTEAAPEDFSHLLERLGEVGDQFLRRRERPLPMIVKFSNDTEPAQVAKLVGHLVELGFDGVNFGNTSTAYQSLRPAIAAAERPLYDYFTATFGGGVSGRPLAARSLELCRLAVAEVTRLGAGDRFHVLRTGGIESAADVLASEAAGVALNQWFSGYFDALAHEGHEVYAAIYRGLVPVQA